MIKKETMGLVAAYLKTQKPGAQVVMTAGPNIPPRNLRRELKQRGVKVSVTGEYGNRIITYVAPDTHTPERIHGYNKSQNVDDPTTPGAPKTKDENLSFGAQKAMIKTSVDGPEIFVKGNKTTIIRGLRRLGFVGRYSVNKSGDGCLVSVRSKNAPQKFDAIGKLVAYLAANPLGTKALLIGGGSWNKEGIHTRFATRGMQISIEEVPGGLLISYSSQIPGYRRPDDPTFLKNCREKLLEDGPAIYVEGSYSSLIKMLVGWGYKGRYNMKPRNPEERLGQKTRKWMVSVRSKVGSRPLLAGQ